MGKARGKEPAMLEVGWMRQDLRASMPLTSSLEDERDRISWRESPGWNCMMSASICLVLWKEGSDGGEVRDGAGSGLGLARSCK